MERIEIAVCLSSACRAVVSGDTQPSGRTILLICYSVMPGLVPGIHVVLSVPDDVDGRDKPRHDGVEGDERIMASPRA